MTLDEARAAFYAGERGPQMPFVVNDSVRVVGGTASGLTGAVISVEEIEPGLVYLVESGQDGNDTIVAANDLQLLDTNGQLEK